MILPYMDPMGYIYYFLKRVVWSNSPGSFFAQRHGCFLSNFQISRKAGENAEKTGEVSQNTYVETKNSFFIYIYIDLAPMFALYNPYVVIFQPPHQKKSRFCRANLQNNQVSILCEGNVFGEVQWCFQHVQLPTLEGRHFFTQLPSAPCSYHSVQCNLAW